MKKKILLLFLVATNLSFVFAGGNWATSAVSISKDGGSPYLYRLNNEGWTNGTWGSNIDFNTFDFGTPTNLILNGGAGNAWADGGDFYDSNSFVIYYRVYKNGDTPGSWNQVLLPVQSYHVNNDYIYEKTNANIDLLSLATTSSSIYTLEVVMSKNQMWSGGNYMSMIPGGQATPYNSTNSGYKATFKTSSANTDYFRSKTTGNWGDATSWESSSDNINWGTATSVPEWHATSVSVESGHELTCDGAFSASSLTIKPNGKVTINLSATLGITGNLLIQSDASGTGTFVDKNTTSGYTVNGTTFVEQTLGADRNWYVSSPITAAAIPVAENVYYYDETVHNVDPNASWLTPTGNLAVGKGYIIDPTSVAFDKITFNGTL
ncbi:MAG TPA: hypothetical protein P5084_15685, partial [Paludibacter sp.]|nr:hypothetical protein [Paludibacter sp.]